MRVGFFASRGGRTSSRLDIVTSLAKSSARLQTVLAVAICSISFHGSVALAATLQSVGWGGWTQSLPSGPFFESALSPGEFSYSKNGVFVLQAIGAGSELASAVHTFTPAGIEVTTIFNTYFFIYTMQYPMMTVTVQVLSGEIVCGGSGPNLPEWSATAGQTIVVPAEAVLQGNQAILTTSVACATPPDALGRTTAASILVQDISVGNILDLSIPNQPTIYQNGQTNYDPNGDGIVDVISGVQGEISFFVQGKGIIAGDTRTTTAKLYVGEKLLASTTLVLRDVANAPGGLYPISFLVNPHGSGLKTARVVVDEDNALNEVTLANNSQSFTVMLVEPQVSVSNLVVTQAVPNFKIDAASPALDIVAGKSTVGQVFLKGTNILPTDGRSITVQFQPGQSAVPQQQNIPLNAIVGVTGPSGAELDFYFTPAGSGPDQIAVTIDPSAQVMPAPTGTSLPASIDVSRNLKLGFVPIDGCGPTSPNCYLGAHLAEYNLSVVNAGTFVQATYPIPDLGNKIGDLGISNFAGAQFQVLTQTKDAIGVATDLLNLGMLAKLHSPPLDFVGGIVPPTYFAYHKYPSNYVGYTVPAFAPPFSSHAFLAVDSYWDAPAHELGHLTGGSPDLYDAGGNCPIGSFVNGFWPAQKQAIPLLPGLMCSTQSSTLLANWIDASSFSLALQYFQKPQPDPAVLVISGILNADGSFQSDSIHALDTGTLSPGGSGDFTVTLLGTAGETLYQLSEQTSFFAFGDPSPGVPVDNISYGRVPVSSIPVLLSVPYPQNVDQVQIARAGQTLAAVSPNSQALLTAIKSIPSAEFISDSAKHEAVLLERTNFLDLLLLDCGKNRKNWDNQTTLQCSKRSVDILLEIREKVVKWLDSSYAASNPLQYTQAQVLSTIDAVILRVVPKDIQVVWRRDSFSIYPLQAMSPDLFKVTQVSQPIYGSAEIDKDGDKLVYTPKQPFDNIKNDVFSFTITNPEGAQATGTVTVLSPLAVDSARDHGRKDGIKSTSTADRKMEDRGDDIR